MSKLRSVSTAFWSDPFVEGLSPNEKLIYLYLITNDKTNMLGIFEVSKRKISFETGVDIEMVSKALKGFERANKIFINQDWIVIVNHMKNHKFNTNMQKSAIDIYNSLPKHMKIIGLEVSKDNPLEAFERLSNHRLMLPKVEVEVEGELEDET